MSDQGLVGSPQAATPGVEAATEWRDAVVIGSAAVDGTLRWFVRCVDGSEHRVEPTIYAEGWPS